MKHKNLKIGDRVRSLAYGIVGYLHHMGTGQYAWVSDFKDGSSGQFHDIDDLSLYKPA